MNTPDRRDELKTVALICLALNDCLCTANLLDIDPVCFENVRNTYRTAIMNLCDDARWYGPIGADRNSRFD